ncbi:MAG: hypothetical protein H0V30_13130 [Chitinophagaceae bacterium]|jgi:hypothetical protein|nr:hypothetical protein [Chitinophagaceae bacterium]
MFRQFIYRNSKKTRLVILFLFINIASFAQCSICTRTAQQLGEGPAQDLNAGIMYLAFAPLVIMGYIGYRWFRSEK